MPPTTQPLIRDFYYSYQGTIQGCTLKMINGPDLEYGVPPGQENLFLEFTEASELPRIRINAEMVKVLREVLK